MGRRTLGFLEHGAFMAIVPGMQHMPYEQHIPRNQ